ncbi:MAG: hypothetical protein WCA38_07070, partial [Candidatus Acidiferrales bacterium]
QIPCAARTPLEKTMEADISIWRKPGHFYFALTSGFAYYLSPQNENVLFALPISSCTSSSLMLMARKFGRSA